MNKEQIGYKTLAELFTLNDWATDKGTIHDYINAYYTNEFHNTKSTTEKVLEIGIWNGGCLRLWKEWFTNAQITGMDVHELVPTLFGEPQEGIEIIIKDGYQQETIDSFPNDTYDYIIDDGPHTLESMVIAVKQYLPKVKPGGKLIIEDVQDIEWIKVLEDAIDKELSVEWKTFDMRDNKGRYDDIIFEVKRKFYTLKGLDKLKK